MYIIAHCCCFFNFHFSSLPLSSIDIIQSSQSFFISDSLSLGCSSKHFFLTYAIILGSSGSFPLPLTFEFRRVSVSTSSFTKAAANDLLVLNFIKIGQRTLGWISSLPSKDNKNSMMVNCTVMYACCIHSDHSSKLHINKLHINKQYIA